MTNRVGTESWQTKSIVWQQVVSLYIALFCLKIVNRGLVNMHDREDRILLCESFRLIAVKAADTCQPKHGTNHDIIDSHLLCCFEDAMKNP